MKPNVVVVLLVSILVIFFALSNNYLVDVNFLITQVRVSMPVLLIATFGSGVLTTLFLHIPSWWRARSQKKNLNHQIKELQEQLEQYTGQQFDAKDIHDSDVDEFLKDVENED